MREGVIFGELTSWKRARERRPANSASVALTMIIPVMFATTACVPLPAFPPGNGTGKWICCALLGYLTANVNRPAGFDCELSRMTALQRLQGSGQVLCQSAMLKRQFALDHHLDGPADQYATTILARNHHLAASPQAYPLRHGHGWRQIARCQHPFGKGRIQ